MAVSRAVVCLAECCVLFLPLSTDAPVYYWPYGTVGLIVANVLVFVGMVAGAIDPFAGWLLVHGDGLHPVQWLLSMFAHAGVMHLVGNMVFLWIFGLVVEGKLGWARFMACYLGIGVCQSALEQVCWLATDQASFSLGASSAIYGLMAIAAVWAPKNDVTVFMWVFVFARTFEAPIALLALLYIGLDLTTVLLSAGQMSSSWLHVTGAMVGFPLGVVLLKRGVVDCEGWDMFHVWSNDLGGHKKRDAEQAKASEERERRRAESDTNMKIGAQVKLHEFLKQGNAAAALTLYNKMRDLRGGLELSVDELRALVGGLHKAGRYADSAPFMAELITRAPEAADPVRIKLAQVCVVRLGRPGRALELLADVDAGKLPGQHQQLVKKIGAQARKMQEQGVVELDDGGW